MKPEVSGKMKKSDRICQELIVIIPKIQSDFLFVFSKKQSGKGSNSNCVYFNKRRKNCWFRNDKKWRKRNKYVQIHREI